MNAQPPINQPARTCWSCRNRIFHEHDEPICDLCAAKQPAEATPKDDLVREIAKTYLSVTTIETQYPAERNYHDLASWQIVSAIRAAYTAGCHAGLNRGFEIGQRIAGEIPIEALQKIAADHLGIDRMDSPAEAYALAAAIRAAAAYARGMK